MQDQVLACSQASAGFEHDADGADESGKETACGVEAGGSAPDSGTGAHARLPRLLENHLQLRAAFARRLPTASFRHRFRTDGTPHPWKRGQGSVRAPGGSHTAFAARTLENTPLATLGVSRNESR